MLLTGTDGGVGEPRHPLPGAVDPGNQVVTRSVVGDDPVGPGQALGPARLRGHAPADVVLRHPPALDQPPDGHLLGAVDDHHDVGMVPRHFHEKGHDRDHHPVGVGVGLELLEQHVVHRRVHDRLQRGPGRAVGEDQPGQSAPVDAVVGIHHVGTETVDHGVVSGAARLHHLAGDLVGIHHDRSPLGQQGGHRRLSRSDAPGEANDHHGDILPSLQSVGRPYDQPISVDPLLFSARPDERLAAARAVKGRARRALEERARDWPPFSPASLNAWLLFVTTKPPDWRDDLLAWEDHPPTLGQANQGFYYPDPLGFWAEVRRWSLELFRLRHPTWAPPDALALTTLLHVGGDPDRLARAMGLSQPQTILFLDEPSWERSRLPVRSVAHHIADPHRRGQVYEGFWGHAPDGGVVGKAPQHPTTHNLYRAEDMLGFLRSAPAPRHLSSEAR